MHVFRQCNNWIIYLSGNITTIHYYNINCHNDQCTAAIFVQTVLQVRLFILADVLTQGAQWTDCIIAKFGEKNLNTKIHYHNIKEHLKLSKIAKFDCEML